MDVNGKRSRKTGPLSGTAMIPVTAISFVLNLCWEYAQCVPFFIHRTGEATHRDMMEATLGDVFLTWIAFVSVAMVRRDFSWMMRRRKSVPLVMSSVTGLLLAILVEAWALKTGRWSYTDINPLVFGISLVPILQLAILFPLTFWFAGICMRRGSGGNPGKCS